MDFNQSWHYSARKMHEAGQTAHGIVHETCMGPALMTPQIRRVCQIRADDDRPMSPSYGPCILPSIPFGMPVTFNLVGLMPLRPLFRTSLVAATLVALTACLDRDVPVAPDAAGPDPSNRQDFQVSCVASVASGTVDCALPESVGSQALIIGGQGQYVQVTSSNVAVVADTFSFDVTVQNLIHQPMGTLDGTTPHEDGVRVFFEQLPTTTGGTGSIIVANADGEDTFLRAGQPYYQWDGILRHTQITDPRNWQFVFDPGVDTFVFTVFVSAEVPSETDWVDLSGSPQYLLPGGATDTSRLTAVVRDRVGNPIDGAITFTSSDPSVVEVTSSGAVWGVSVGYATITASAGEAVGEWTIGVCAPLMPGSSAHYSGAAAQRICLPSNDVGGSQFVIVPVNTSTVDASITLQGTNIVPPAGGPTPNLVPVGTSFMLHGPRTLDEFHGNTGVRRAHAGNANVRSTRSGARLTPSAPNRAIVPGMPSVGDEWTLNVAPGCEGAPDPRVGRVEVISEHAVIVADTANPYDLSLGEYVRLAGQIDSVLAPVVYHHLVADSAGAPHDINGNGGRIVYFFSAAVNEQLNPWVSQEYGYFTDRDLLQTDDCARSNAGGIIYLATPDPGGFLGATMPVDTLLKYVPRTIVHELQHLTNRLIRDDNGAPAEEAWLDEAMSLIMQEIAFYAEPGEQPRQNIGGGYFTGPDAAGRIARYGRYMYHTVEDLGQWLRDGNATGPLNEVESEAAAGAAWAFLRYAADQAFTTGDQATLWRSLAGSSLTGRANLAAALPGELSEYLAGFGGALYVDDVAGLGTVAPELRFPSWNFRSLFAGVGGYPLVTTPLANGVADSQNYAAGGGMNWFRTGVAASNVGEFTFDVGGGALNDLEVVIIATP